MSPSICGARHPITRDRCILSHSHQGDHVASVAVNSIRWPASESSPRRDGRERVKGRHRRDARSWGWTEAQR